MNHRFKINLIQTTVNEFRIIIFDQCYRTYLPPAPTPYFKI